MTRRNSSGPLLFDEEIDHTACKNRREIRQSLRYTEEEQEDDFSTTIEEMAKNLENPIPPVTAVDPVNQNLAPRTMYDYAKPSLTRTESSIMDLETLYDAWERYKDLLRRCPHHGLPLWLQFLTFYNGVNPSTRQMIDAAVGGTINNKTPEAAYEFIEEMSLNNYQWQFLRTKPTKTASVYNIEVVNMLSNQVELLNEKIDGLLGSTQVHPVMRCDSGGGGVHTEYQPFNPTTEEEQVHYMGNQRPQNLPGFQQPPYQQENKPNLEEMLTKFISVSETHFQNTETALKKSTSIDPRAQSSDRPAIQINFRANTSEERLVVSEPEPKQETVESKVKGKIDHNEQKQMPNAIKFLKELLANKRKLDEASHVELNAVYSAILQNKLPNKLKDPGSFTIPCLIGSVDVNNALADLGASINVMPHKIFKQLGLGKPEQTRMSIQLANKTIRFPRGIIEDEISSKDIHEPCSSNNKGPIHEERRLQIEELDEWQTYKPKTRHDELNFSQNQLKVGEKVLLDAADPRITTSELNGASSLMVLNIFPYGTVEAHRRALGRVHNTRRDTAMRYGCVKIGQGFFPNTGYDKLPSPCDMAVDDPAKTTRACDTPMSKNHG
ncbi:hypothetical protein CXB51_008094 [Gossypium anomalum]|uniref:Retrotransposon gag domain-containing protein n=1 Tax=Gossypium anomalum TaxID=47600 RepID=A0A8J6D7U0_9ROSI|nr:hypothetical protein CXB51_008094 [Gossypium anomalum]